MNAAHLHLLTNHLSLVGVGFAFLLNIVSLARKNYELQKICCWFYVLTAMLALLPIITGDGAQEILVSYPGISTDAIELHETWGYSFFYGTLGVAVLALAALWFSRKHINLLKKFSISLLVAAAIVLFLAWEAGVTGGILRHPEIEQGAFGKAG